MNSGPFIGVVDGHALFDATASHPLPHVAGATVTQSATNLFHRRTRYFIGAPTIGRLIQLRVSYDL